MLDDVEVMMGKYIIGCGKMIYGKELVKIFLHQLWNTERVKQHAGPRYDPRSTDLCIFDLVLVMVVYFQCV